MGNESGTWVMYGVEWDDPECIHTVDEAIEYINSVGFLPLFKQKSRVLEKYKIPINENTNKVFYLLQIELSPNTRYNLGEK